MATDPVKEGQCPGCREPNAEFYSWGGCKLCGYTKPPLPTRESSDVLGPGRMYSDAPNRMSSSNPDRMASGAEAPTRPRARSAAYEAQALRSPSAISEGDEGDELVRACARARTHACTHTQARTTSWLAARKPGRQPAGTSACSSALSHARRRSLAHPLSDLLARSLTH